MPKDWSLTLGMAWDHTREVETEPYRCGYCSHEVSSNVGLETEGRRAFVRICPQCNGPTFFTASHPYQQWPGPREGGEVAHIPGLVQVIYKEARDSLSINAYTASVMICRKILMNVAVEKGAKADLKFAAYVGWLVDQGYAPKGSEGWVAYVKDRGNEANHEITPMTRADAVGVLRFTEQLLRNIFELPNLVPPKPASQSGTASNAPSP